MPREATTTKKQRRPISHRREANALTCEAFRRGAPTLENLHAGKSTPLTDDLALSRFTRDEIDQIWREATDRLVMLLKLRAEQPEKYWKLIQKTDREWTYYWETTSLHAAMKR